MKKPAPKRIPISQQVEFRPSDTPLPGTPLDMLTLASQVIVLAVKTLFALIALIIGGIGLILTRDATMRGIPTFWLILTLFAGYFFVILLIQFFQLYPQLRAVQRAWKASQQPIIDQTPEEDKDEG
ncbi:MAG: hypothetical protein ACYC7E_19270 [Armatimonadota bacterium]